eukprot:m.136658 g.136658  ORF g.136658 m.136658 type:complete len:295 (-) comp17578_c0_seq2:270-1154(-)
MFWFRPFLSQCTLSAESMYILHVQGQRQFHDILSHDLCTGGVLWYYRPATGTADIYFKQLMSLGSAGFRVISVDYPIYWSHDEWCIGFSKLLDALGLDSVHLFGASLGGFLAQKFAEHTKNSRRVQSLLLTNSFIDTNAFKHLPNSKLYKMMPGFVMKRLVLKSFPRSKVDAEVANSIDFVIERLDSIGREHLASRMTLNTMPAYVEPQTINAQEMKVMIVDVLDQSAIAPKVFEEVSKCYPEAKVAHLRSGGTFPYLSNDQELNMYIKVHLRAFSQTRYTAGDDFEWGSNSAK